MKKVSIVDYGIGNLLSVKRALEFAGAQVSIATKAEEITSSDRIVVPGVGAFKNCMTALKENNLNEALIEFALSGRPYLGICVGMQMLLDKSFEFGEQKGLGLIPGEVKKIEIPNQTVPFIGWKKVEIDKNLGHYYFVHSYQARPSIEPHATAKYDLCGEKITAIVSKDNITGVQFHPEKSAQDGLNFLRNFLNENHWNN